MRTRAAAERGSQGDGRAVARRGGHLERARQIPSALADAHEPVAIGVFRRVEALAIVADPEKQVVPIEVHLDLGSRALRVSKDVVDRLFEEQEDFASKVGAHLDVAIEFWRAEFELDVPGGEPVAGEAAHPPNQILKRVPFRVDRPHDIAHRFD